MIQAINLSTPVVPNPVVGFCPNNDNEVPNSVPDVFPNKSPVPEQVKPFAPIASSLHSASLSSFGNSCF